MPKAALLLDRKVDLINPQTWLRCVIPTCLEIVACTEGTFKAETVPTIMAKGGNSPGRTVETGGTHRREGNFMATALYVVIKGIMQGIVFSVSIEK